MRITKQNAQVRDFLKNESGKVTQGCVKLKNMKTAILEVYAGNDDALRVIRSISDVVPLDEDAHRKALQILQKYLFSPKAYKKIVAKLYKKGTMRGELLNEEELAVQQKNSSGGLAIIIDENCAQFDNCV